jgi:hypothetical protein
MLMEKGLSTDLDCGRRMRGPTALLVLTGAVLMVTSPAVAAEPALNISGIYTIGDTVCLDFQLKDAVTADVMERVREGVPLEIVFKIEVWRDRFWFDRTIATAVVSCIFRYDSWDTAYCITKAREGSALREAIRSGSMGEIVHNTCVYTGLKTCSVAGIRPDKNYFVVVRSEMRYLSAERTGEIESWLRGEDPGEDEGGGLLDLILGAFGARSKSVESRKQYFSLASISR